MIVKFESEMVFVADITGVAEVWERSAGCPGNSSLVAALRQRDIRVEYLCFEDEGHGLVKRANRLSAYPAIASFLDKYLR